MTALGQQHPLTDVDPQREYDAVGADPLKDQARASLTLLTENAIRGVVGEYEVVAHPPCPRCGCIGLGKRT